MDTVGVYDTMHVERIDRDAMIVALRQQVNELEQQLAAAKAAIKPISAATLSSLLGT